MELLSLTGINFFPKVRAAAVQQEILNAETCETIMQ